MEDEQAGRWTCPKVHMQSLNIHCCKTFNSQQTNPINVELKTINKMQQRKRASPLIFVDTSILSLAS